MQYSFSLKDFSAYSLKNVLFSLYSKGPLLSKAVNGRFFVPQELCYKIADTIMMEKIIEAMRASHELVGIEIKDDQLIFSGFSSENQIPAGIIVSEQPESSAPEQAEAQIAPDQENEQIQELPTQNQFEQPEQSETQNQENTPEQSEQQGFTQEATDEQEIAQPESSAPEQQEQPETQGIIEQQETAQASEQPENPAITAFLSYFIKHCKTVNYVQLVSPETDNERYTMRGWFNQLGWKGKDDRPLRTYFYERLSGHTAFRTEENKQRWLEARKAERDGKINSENQEQINEPSVIETENYEELMNAAAEEPPHASDEFEEPVNAPEVEIQEQQNNDSSNETPEMNTSSGQVANLPNEFENQEALNALGNENYEQVANLPSVEDIESEQNNGPA